MNLQAMLIHWSRGEDLGWFWRLFWWRKQCPVKVIQNFLTVFLNRMAHTHGGYIGNGAAIDGRPILPHGLHGIYISRYAHIGVDCQIYQNVTIGEVNRSAPQIGDHCLIGAGAVVIGNITIGDYVKIGAGAIVCSDIPSRTTVIAPPSRIIVRGAEYG